MDVYTIPRKRGIKAIECLDGSTNSLAIFQEYIAKTEGIIAAIESSHAIAYAKKLAPTMKKDQVIIVTVSGRGDKDCAAIARYRGEDIHE